MGAEGVGWNASDGGERPDVILTVGFEAIPIGRGDAGRVVGRLDQVAPPDVDLGDSCAVEARGGGFPTECPGHALKFVCPAGQRRVALRLGSVEWIELVARIPLVDVARPMLAELLADDAKVERVAILSDDRPATSAAGQSGHESFEMLGWSLWVRLAERVIVPTFGVAAGCLYYAARELDGYGAVTQAELAVAARISDVSLQHVWQDLQELDLPAWPTRGANAPTDTERRSS